MSHATQPGKFPKSKDLNFKNIKSKNTIRTKETFFINLDWGDLSIM